MNVGTVESLWRYPVKSMRGEELREIFVGFGGFAGDRLFAFRSSAAPTDFPYFTARQQKEMLRYKPRLAPNESSLQVEMPSGETLAIDDPRLIESLRASVDARHELSLMQSERALADAFPVSLISLNTVQALAAEAGIPPEKRRFRANIYADLSGSPFAENDFVGRQLRIGRDVVVAVAKWDARCVMINLHPDSTAASPALLKTVAQRHGGTAGVYGDVVNEGIIRTGDSIELLSAQ
ncbi:MAG: MOSC domain-containing protein [Verrucomicrobiota bacterium]|nr:MOSC domain-containing protein [Verrucomicrobiota bacterium]